MLLTILFLSLVSCYRKEWGFSPCANDGQYCEIPADAYSGAIMTQYTLNGKSNFYTIPNANYRLLVAYGASGQYVYKEFGVNMNVLYCHYSVFGNPAQGINTDARTCSYKYIYNPKNTSSKEVVSTNYLIPAGEIYFAGYTGEDMVAYVMGNVSLYPYLFGGESYTYYNGKITHWDLKYRDYVVYTEDLSHMYGVWDFCANEGFYCKLPSNDTVYSILFGTGAYTQDVVYSNVIKDFSGGSILCSTANFPDVPVQVSNFPQGARRFCKITTKTIFTDIVGYWELAVSCNNCSISETLQLGVTSSSMLATTKTWSAAYTKSIQRELQFKIGNSVTQTSRSTAASVSSMSMHAFSQSLVRSCTATCHNVQSLWQWKLTSSEVCKLYDTCNFDTFTCNYICKDDLSSPLCPLGSCLDKECTVCREDY